MPEAGTLGRGMLRRLPPFQHVLALVDQIIAREVQDLNQPQPLIGAIEAES